MKIFVFWILIKITACGRLCMKCDQVVHPTACSSVIRCSDNEECHVTRYADINGEILYDVGCLDKQLCHNQTHSHIHKRFLLPSHNCRECCNDTDVCNLGGLCNTTEFHVKNNLLCYQCEQRHSADSCSHITLCGQDQSCFIGEKDVGILGIPVYETKCLNTKVDCPVLDEVNKTAGLHKCAKCCNTSFCNNECHIDVSVTPKVTPTVTSSVTTAITPTNSSQYYKPEIVLIGGVDSVNLNADVRLFCSVRGVPTPNVGWNFLTTDSNIKNMYVEGNGHVLVIENYQHYNDGKYQCWAENSQGRTEKVMVISGK